MDIKEKTYYVSGMHCSACEVLIEKNILEIENVETVDASTGSGKVVVNYIGNSFPRLEKLNQIFKEQGYTFSFKPKEEKEKWPKSTVFTLALVVIASIFLISSKFNLSGLAVVNADSSPSLFLIFGLIAGVSSCAALVGGLVLSMSKQWLDIHKGSDSFADKMKPHFLFNIGRLISYALFGGLLGLIGGQIQFSMSFAPVLVLIVSVIMAVLGLQMMGVGYFRKFQIRVPKFVSRYIADESNFKGKYMPFVLGGLTFFLPCGFTVTAQGIALISGSWVAGMTIMTFFALGTLLPLLIIGASSIALTNKFQTSFLKLAGVLVLFFSLFNINTGLNSLGLPSFSDLKTVFVSEKSVQSDKLVKVVNGKQVIEMSAFSYEYTPNYFKVKVGIPVRWEITDNGASGCTNAVISRNLFEGEIRLERGRTVAREFTPSKKGKYKFSCWMGMVGGVIEVI